MAIRIGIYGYGNLGRGAELAVGHAPDTVSYTHLTLPTTHLV